MAEEQKNISGQRKKTCSQCGAELTYAPGTDTITCPYCGHVEKIDVSENGFEELELKPYLEKMGSQSHSVEMLMVTCKHCGAKQNIEENYKSLNCAYCGTPLILDEAKKEEWILPGAVLPFQFNQSKAHQIFQNWVKKMWWAPNKLKKAALQPEYTKGLYVPYWTFDAQLRATYSGQRGEHYYVTRTVGSGNNRHNVQEMRTRWYPASGQVSGFVDDSLVMASKKRQNEIPSKIRSWNLNLLKPYDASFLAGFVTEKYTLPLNEGHVQAEQIAKSIAANWIRRDIGGDTQQITGMDMQLSDETFKHVLLPVYISSYSYNGTRYQFFINGQSGTISGKRPYSFWKIFFAVVIGLIVLGLIMSYA
jgi:DNA-directed RNA polymerase subunit RPC12/RpoP